MEGKVFTFDSTTRAFRACVGVVGGRSCHAVLETTTNNYSPLSLSLLCRRFSPPSSDVGALAALLQSSRERRTTATTNTVWPLSPI